MIGSAPVAVMLVDDDPGDVVLVREAFSRRRLIDEIRVATDGVEALAELRDESRPLPDLVLLDLNLPRMGGREVLAEIRADPRLTRLPVVILSTSDAQADVMCSYELHANAFVTKPLDLERFLTVVGEIDHFFLSVVKLPHRP